MTRVLPARRRGATRALVLLFAAALLWAQMLGLAHAVLHGPLASAGQHEAHGLEAGAEEASSAGLLGHLLGHADQQDAPDCQLWDQLGQTASLAGLPVLQLPPLLPFFLAPAPVPRIVKDLFAPYGARAPPLVG